MFNNTRTRFVFDPSVAVPEGGFSFKGPDGSYLKPTQVAIPQKSKLIEHVSQVTKLDPRLIDWEYLSRTRLTDDEIDTFKEHLVWPSVSRRISLKTAQKFRDYVDWSEFRRRIDSYVRDQIQSKINGVRNGDDIETLINLDNHYHN